MIIVAFAFTFTVGILNCFIREPASNEGIVKREAMLKEKGVQGHRASTLNLERRKSVLTPARMATKNLTFGEKAKVSTIPPS